MLVSKIYTSLLIKSECFFFVSGFSDCWLHWFRTSSLVVIVVVVIFLGLFNWFNAKLISHQLSNLFLKDIQRSSFVHCTLHCFLLLSSFNYSIFDSIFGDELIDKHISSLADSVSSVSSLGIHGGIPIIVIEYHIVGSCQGYS